MAQYVDVEKYLNDNFCDEFDECVSDEDCFVCWARRHTEDVAPVVHAEWKRNIADFFVCSNCNYIYGSREYAYCPHCGAKMDKE